MYAGKHQNKDQGPAHVQFFKVQIACPAAGDTGRPLQDAGYVNAQLCRMGKLAESVSIQTKQTRCDMYGEGPVR